MTEKQTDDDDSTNVPSVFKRKLDLTAKASLDVVSLNNVIVKMRPKIHASKRIVISKLRERIKRLRNFKAPEEQKQANEKKALDREKEIALIKALHHDHVSKFAIGSTDKLETVFSRPGVSLEQIALVRLAGHKYIQDVVQDFRKSHSDWKELAAFLMTKHTNREFKKKKKPDVLTTQMKQQKRMKTKTNIEASETLVKSYLKEKLKNEEIESGAESDMEEGKRPADTKVEQQDDKESEKEDSGNESSDNESDADDGEDDDHDGEFEDIDDENDERVGSGSDIDKGSDASDTDGSDSDENAHPFENDNKGAQGNHISSVEKSSQKEKGSVEKGTRKDKTKALDTKAKKGSDSNDSIKKKKESKQKSDSIEKKPSKPKVLEKSQGEIIVKKLNLDDWSFSEPANDKIPEILLSKGVNKDPEVKDESVKPKKKKAECDPFFDTGNRLFQSRDSKPGELGKNLLAFAGYSNKQDDSEKQEDSAVEVHEMDNDSFSFQRKNDNRVVDDYDDIFNEKSRRDGSVYMKANNIGKQAFRTTFMESLNSSGMEKFSGRGKFSKDRRSERDNGKGRGKHPKERDFDKIKVGVSAGTKAKLKKKGMFQVRDSKQEELGTNLLNIAGYDKDSKSGSGSFEAGSDKGLWDRKGSKNPVVSSQGNAKKPEKNQSVHPSWEASMKRKQQQSGIMEFSGKKIKFDD